MICQVCHRDTAPIFIGETEHCSVCGNRYQANPTPTTSTPAATTATRRMDMSPRRPAAALHSRVGGAGTLDLRAAPAAPTSPATLATPAPAANHIPANPPHQAAHERHTAHLENRLQAAKTVERSPHINRFSGARVAPARLDLRPVAPAAPTAAAPAVPAAAPQPLAIAPNTPPARQELPPAAATQHEAMTRLTPAPPPAPAKIPAPTSPGWRPHLGLSPHLGRIGTTSAAILIMGSYIWLQNYPKLALQNASSQAGLSASLPGYLPSSYNLASTKTSPGLVSLTFTSPSFSELLHIDQHRTSWDSSSLLDNFVAKNADDYSTIHGQGLTIYLFGQNEAAWVNHGIWYSIAGASHLSREQILKIAYSL